jgi:hypothetical protein
VRVPSARRVDRRQTGMMAITDLDELLANLSARQRPGRWCLVSGPPVPDGIDVAATVVEEEGITSVIRVEDAARLGVEVSFIAAWLTLEVRSALEAVGLTAAVSAALAAEQIPANVLAGFHHDHVLVPYADADRAIAVLDALSASGAALG